jgi:ABC-type lipoprotein release transport system permease subunit
MRAFARQGRDVYIAIAITAGVGIGVSALIVGLSAIQG